MHANFYGINPDYYELQIHLEIYREKIHIYLYIIM